MNDQNTESVAPQAESKPRLRDRLFGGSTVNNATSKPKTPVVEKAKNVAAVIGVLTVIGVTAAIVTKRKSVDIDLTLPDVDISTASD